MNAIIIDDELSARESLRLLFETFIPDVKVVAEADGIGLGLATIRSLKPDIVFLDINMPSGTGFDLLEQLDEIDFFLVFVTAYDQYGIKAIKYSALDYLLKPVDLLELRKTIERIQSVSNKQMYHRLVDHYRQNANRQETIALPTIEGFDIVKIQEILRCEGERNYTTFFMKNGERIVVSRTLKEFETLLEDNALFLRVHKSHLINIDCVRKYIHGRGGIAVLEDGEQIPISREKKDVLLQRINAK